MLVGQRGLAMCNKQPLRGCECTHPPLTAEELYKKCVALRKQIDADIEKEKEMQEMIKEHEYMGWIRENCR